MERSIGVFYISARTSESWLISSLVDEEEVYRTFGGCLPAAAHSRIFFSKASRRLDGQRKENVVEKMKKEGKYALVLLALLLLEERQCAELQVILGQMMRRKFY